LHPTDPGERRKSRGNTDEPSVQLDHDGVTAPNGADEDRCEEGKEAAQVHLWSKVLHSEAQLSGDTEVEMCVPELRK
jgi:hypothetical protein